MFESHRVRLCLSRRPLRYAALGTGTAARDVHLHCSAFINSALHPSGVAGTRFGGEGEGGNVTSAGWQVTLCDPIWHMSSRSGAAV